MPWNTVIFSVWKLGPDDLIADLNTFGLIFETLCIRDLRTYSEALNCGVYHYRDKWYSPWGSFPLQFSISVKKQRFQRLHRFFTMCQSCLLIK